MSEESIAEATGTEATASRGDGDRRWPPDALVAVREDRRRRWVALAVAAAVGVALAWVHWLGLVAGGVLVGVVSATTPRAVAAGVVVGAATVALTVLASPTMSWAEFLALRPPVYVALGGGLLPAWGALVRALG